MAELKGRQPQRGAALLIAMIILALVATLASAMVWQQWRAVQVEAAERARSQSSWILTGASDWARLILSEDTNLTDSLADIWATPLQEARLSTFLAADKDNTDDGPEAFLSGSIVDAQSRYNLRNLALVTGTDVPLEIARFVKLLDTIGVNGSSLGPQIARAMQEAFPKAPGAAASGAASASTATTVSYLAPHSIDQLSWFGIDDDSIARMTPYLTILPSAAYTMVNVNTASKEVLAAVAGIEMGAAQQMVQRRRSKPFDQTIQPLTDVGTQPAVVSDASKRLSVVSTYFEVTGRLRLGDRVLEEVSLMQRNGKIVTPVLRRRQSLRDVTP